MITSKMIKEHMEKLIESYAKYSLNGEEYVIVSHPETIKAVKKVLGKSYKYASNIEAEKEKVYVIAKKDYMEEGENDGSGSS